MTTAPHSGLYINREECEYCAAWPDAPCAFHDPDRIRRSLTREAL